VHANVEFPNSSSAFHSKSGAALVRQLAMARFSILCVVPFLTLICMLPLLPLPTTPAVIISTSRLPPLPPVGEPLLSRLLARRLLELSETAADVARVRQAQSRSALASLNRTATPLLTICPPPMCGACEMLVLTLVHQRTGGGPPHDPHRSVVEQWTRPAQHYLRPADAPSAMSSVAAAARDGLGAAFDAAVEQLRIAMHPQLMSDPHDWQLVWRQRLPGTAEQLASSADGCRLAIAYRRVGDETVTQHIRYYALHPPSEGVHPEGRCPAAAPAAATATNPVATAAVTATATNPVATGAATAAGAATATATATASASAAADAEPAFEPMYEDIDLRGNLPVSSLALAGDTCLVYARVHDHCLMTFDDL
jgi:hypothetical protein